MRLGATTVIVAYHWPAQTVVIADVQPELLADAEPLAGWQRAWLIQGHGCHRQLPIWSADHLRKTVALTYWTREDGESTVQEIAPDLRRRARRVAGLADRYGTAETAGAEERYREPRYS
jgi:hypothetical protein